MERRRKLNKEFQQKNLRQQELYSQIAVQSPNSVSSDSSGHTTNSATLFQIPHHPREELSNTTHMSQFLTTKVKHHIPLQKLLWHLFDQDQASTALNQTHIMVFQTLLEMASMDSFL